MLFIFFYSKNKPPLHSGIVNIYRYIIGLMFNPNNILVVDYRNNIVNISLRYRSSAEMELFPENWDRSPFGGFFRTGSSHFTQLEKKYHLETNKVASL